MLEQDTLKSLHVAKAQSFKRGGYSMYPTLKREDSAFVMF